MIVYDIVTTCHPITKITVMASVTLKKACELTGKSKRTIQRYMASGKLSYNINRNGHKAVDTSELMRVFGDLSLPSAPDVTRQSAPVEMISLTPDQLTNIIKTAVSEALREVVPLLLENKRGKVVEAVVKEEEVKHGKDTDNDAINSSYYDDMSFIKS